MAVCTILSYMKYELIYQLRLLYETTYPVVTQVNSFSGGGTQCAHHEQGRVQAVSSDRW